MQAFYNCKRERDSNFDKNHCLQIQLEFLESQLQNAFVQIVSLFK